LGTRGKIELSKILGRLTLGVGKLLSGIPLVKTSEVGRAPIGQRVLEEGRGTEGSFVVVKVIAPT
jgi:hypothetical protein